MISLNKKHFQELAIFTSIFIPFLFQFIYNFNSILIYTFMLASFVFFFFIQRIDIIFYGILISVFILESAFFNLYFKISVSQIDVTVTEALSGFALLNFIIFKQYKNLENDQKSYSIYGSYS